MSKAFALLLLSTTACTSAEAGDGGRDITAYSCDGIVAAAQVPQIDPELLAPWKQLASAEHVQLGWALRAQHLATAKLPPLTLHAKILLQHQMVLVAQRLDRARRNNPIFYGAHRVVMARILAIAPPKEDFAALGDGAHPHVHAVLGPASGIIERATSTCGEGNSIHASHSHGVLAFRPIRTKSTRALVAQIVAFDNEGLPHITPIVDGMELRSGFTADAPACVIQARADGTLHVAAHGEIEEHQPFVKKSGGGLTCNGCHRTGEHVGARDLRPGKEVADVDRKRDGQVVSLATELWNSFEWNLNWGTGAVDSAP